ncbi:MAG: arginase family protein [bacterium]|nr:arginase family protein [bacterium]
MNFLNLPDTHASQAGTAAVLLPLAYAEAIADAGKSATAIFEASKLLSLWDAETGADLSTLGIQSLEMLRPKGDAQSATEQIYRHSAPYFRKGLVVGAVGGCHLGSLGLMRAANEEQQAASVLHLAAHPHVGGGNGSGSAEEADNNNCMARVREKCVVVHTGIRSMSKAECDAINPDSLVFARDIHASGLNAIADGLDMLGEKIFLAIHLDVLDPAIMPAVAKPEPGGLDWYTLNALIRMAAREKIITGFSISGMCPSATGGLPAELLAAKLVCKILISILQKNR